MTPSKRTATIAIAEAETSPMPSTDVLIRPVRASDLKTIVTIDAQVTGIKKTDYWRERFNRHTGSGRQSRYFLVAEHANDIQGFIVGEVRDWEFGTPPCGWVFGISIRPEARLSGIGTRLLETLFNNFRQSGVTKVRTLLVFDDRLVMKFYRSQGMMAAPMVTLERDLD